MKSFKSILVRVFTVALVLAAASQAPAASLVINNVLYIPLTFTLKATVSIGGKNKTLNVTQKELLGALGQSSSTTLMVATDTGDVWAVKSKALGEDLTVEGFVTVSNSPTGSTSSGTVTTETGSVSLAVYSSPTFWDNVLDPALSETNSGDWVEATGNYTLTITTGPLKKGVQKITYSYSANPMNGTVHAAELSPLNFPATGSIGASGNGNETP